MARSDLRSFITVHDGMPDHPKIGGLSDRAFRLLVESWCWCSRHKTDGVITGKQWRKSGTPKSRKELTDAGLVSIAKDRFVMHDYLKHQPSKLDAEERSDQKRKAVSLANHNRWHEARGLINPECEHCPHEDSQTDHRCDSSEITGEITERSQNLTEVEEEVEEEIDGPTVGAALVANAPDNGPAPAGPGSVDAHAFVRNRIGDHITFGTKNSLAFQVQKLRGEHIDDATIGDALDRWLQRTGVGPGILPSLVDDIRKEARGATSRAPVVGPAVNAVDARVAELLADTAFAPPALRALPGGA
jgi:hypothetical protein